jgi:hypothetical protein
MQFISVLEIFNDLSIEDIIFMFVHACGRILLVYAATNNMVLIL